MIHVEILNHRMKQKHTQAREPPKKVNARCILQTHHCKSLSHSHTEQVAGENPC